MRRFFTIVVVLAVAVLLMLPGAALAKHHKVDICHVPPGNPDNAHTISVSVHAVPAHLAHGDYLGECGVGTALIGDTVWLDCNLDGTQASGEPGIEGAVVQLTNDDTGVISTQATNENGLYLFKNLRAGEYTVTLDTDSVNGVIGVTPPSGSYTFNLIEEQKFLSADFGVKTDPCPPCD
jgi:hypothetical protein